MKQFSLVCCILLSTTWATSAQVFDWTVAKDGSGDFTTIQAAINHVLTENKPERSTVFIKAGTYEEKLYIGSHSVSKTKVISLIGEQRDSVIIRWDDYNGKQIDYYNSDTLITSGGPQSATLTVNAPDFYMENITVVNSYTSKQAVALYNVGDRQTFKNCRLVGFQDTHYLKKGRRSFFYDCQIEGGTDFICAGGTAVFYRCTVKSLAGGQFIAAPEDIPYSALLPSGKTLFYGFTFVDCDLVSDGKLSNGSVYLGRPWQGTSGCLYLSCRLGAHIRPEGWSIWSGTNHLTSFFAEYRNFNASGNALADISRRATWSYQLSDADVNSFLRLNTIYKAGSFSSATTYQPLPLVVAPQPVTNLTLTGGTLSWTPSGANTPVRGYLVYANNRCIGQTTGTTFVDTLQHATMPPVYEVRAVGLYGNLSLPNDQIDTVTLEHLDATLNGPITGLTRPHDGYGQASDGSIDPREYFQQSSTALHFTTPTTCALYNLQGQVVAEATETWQLSLSALPPGLYVLRAVSTLQRVYHRTIIHRP